MTTNDSPTLPAADAAAADATPTEHRCDILIADDAGSSRELLAAILRTFGGRLVVREARDGFEALNQWLELRPRITLLDIEMPGQDGLETLRQIHAIDAGAFVAMITATAGVTQVRQALEAGAAGYVVKPYKPQRILDLLLKYSARSGHPLVDAR